MEHHARRNDNVSDERLGATKMAASASMNVAACLRSTKQPPQCTVTTWASSPPDCLRTPIPAWTVTYERVQACFRCCMLAAAAPHAHKIEQQSWRGFARGLCDAERCLCRPERRSPRQCKISSSELATAIPARNASPRASQAHGAASVFFTIVSS